MCKKPNAIIAKVISKKKKRIIIIFKNAFLKYGLSVNAYSLQTVRNDVYWQQNNVILPIFIFVPF